MRILDGQESTENKMSVAKMRMLQWSIVKVEKIILEIKILETMLG